MGCGGSLPLAAGDPSAPHSAELAVALPRIQNRLPELAGGWESWSVDDLMVWARTLVRVRPGNAAVAIMFLSEANGTTMQLVTEAVGPDGSPGDAAEIRLQHGTPRFAELLDALRAASARRRRPQGSEIYLDLEDGAAAAPAPAAAAPAPAPVPAPAPAPAAAEVAPPPAPSSASSPPDGGLSFQLDLPGLDLGPLGVAMSSMKRAMLMAAEAQASEARERKREGEEWEAKRVEIDGARHAAEARADEEHAHVEALTRQLESMKEVVRRADAERDRERERAIAAEVNAKEVALRAQADVEDARAATGAAVAEARAVAESLLKEREAGWARDREGLLREMSEMRALLERARTAHAETEARNAEHTASLEAQVSSIFESGKRVENDLKEARAKLAAAEETNARTLDETRSKAAADIAALQSSLDSTRERSAASESAAREVSERRISSLQAEIESRDKTMSDFRARLAALEAALAEARAHADRVTEEADEHIALIRADCDAKVNVVRDETAKEVEAAHHAVESTTLNAAKSVSEAQHALQEEKENTADEIARIRRAAEIERQAVVAKAEVDRTQAIAAMKASMELTVSEMENDWEARLAAKDEELQRVRENLESVSLAFRSECGKVTALDSEVRSLKADLASTRRKNLFASAAKAAASGYTTSVEVTGDGDSAAAKQDAAAAAATSAAGGSSNPTPTKNRAFGAAVFNMLARKDGEDIAVAGGAAPNGTSAGAPAGGAK